MLPSIFNMLPTTTNSAWHYNFNSFLTTSPPEEKEDRTIITNPHSVGSSPLNPNNSDDMDFKTNWTRETQNATAEVHLVNRAGVNWMEFSLKHTETWEHTSWPNSCNSETLWAHRIAAVRSQSNSGRAYENVGPQAPKASHFTDSSTYNTIPWTVFGSLPNSYRREYRTPPAPARFQDMKDSDTTLRATLY